MKRVPGTGPRELTLRMAVVLRARPARVFHALTEPAELSHWWGPHGFEVPHVSLDLRVGGTYRFSMQPPEGELFHLRGEFREIDPPRQLAYTFIWEEPDPDDVETTVVLSLVDLDGETRLSLQHGDFATDERRALHEGGWSDSLERLDALILSSPRNAGSP
jgi:uncharacterized protein YndB with AHSA1/START domain